MPSIAAGQTLSGTLSGTDSIDPNFGEVYYIDDYVLTGAGTGQNITVNLTSSSFDTYLYLVDRQTGAILNENDDYSEYTSNSRITFTAEAGASYLIRVSSFDVQETGSYQLTVN